MDILLTAGLAFLQFVLGGMGIYLALRQSRPEHHRYWIGAFVFIGLLGVVLTVWAAYRANDAQGKLSAQLKDIQIEEAGTKGELSGISTILGNVAKTGIPGVKEFADSILKAIGTNGRQRQVEEAKSTDQQLCSRTTALAQKIRAFQTDFESADQDQIFKSHSSMASKTREEALSASRDLAQREILRYQTHAAQFQDQFLAEAKFDADRITDRLSLEKRDEVVNHNGLAVASLANGRTFGADDELVIAGYLDQLARTLCSK